MIHLTTENYKEYIPLRVVAFDYAAAGAQGDGGGVHIYTVDAEHYYLNYAREHWNKEQLAEVIPELVFMFNTRQVPSQYVPEYMMGGNTLLIPRRYDKLLKEAFQEEKRKNPDIRMLYQVRSELVLRLIREDNERKAQATNQEEPSCVVILDGRR